MQQPIEILVLVGSLRRGSYNRLLARAATEVAPEGVSFSFADIAPLPLYNEDLRQTHGEPPAVTTLIEAMRRADAVLIVSPEYNYSVPGVLKNALDWASFGSDHPFKGKPMALMGASTGRFGTVRMQGHLRDILSGLGALLVTKPEVMIADAAAKFDATGRLIDERSRRQVRHLVEALVSWVEKVGRA